MAIAQHLVQATVDTIDSQYNSGGDFPYLQGSDSVTIQFSFLQNNEAITVSERTPLSIYVVTSDLLDFRRSIRFIKNVLSDVSELNENNEMPLKYTLNPENDEDLLSIFSNSGNCQIIFYIGEEIQDVITYTTPTTAWNYKVTNNPVSNIL